MIEQHIVWSSVSKSTKVERYVIQLQVGSQPPYTLQAFRLFKPIPPEEGSTTASDARSRGKSRTPPLRPGRWIWEEGGPSVKYQNETKADPPRACQRFWERGPTEDCVVLGGVKPKPVTSKPEFKGQRHRKRIRRQKGCARTGTHC